MPSTSNCRRARALSLIATAAFALSGCADLAGKLGGGKDPTAGGPPSFYKRLESETVKVDAAAAASMISGYRANNGLGPVTINPLLNAAAEKQAKAMASRDQLSHTVAGSLQSRVEGGGYNAGVAAENIGAGYRTLAEAFSGWRDSPHHKANMLNKGVTEIGIGTAYAPGSKYKVYWSLILAAPYKP